MSGSMSGMWKRSYGDGYSGTARRKGRQQTNRTYCHRATSRLYRERSSAIAHTGRCDQSGYPEPLLGVKQIPMPRLLMGYSTERDEWGASASASSTSQDMGPRLAKLWGNEHRRSAHFTGGGVDFNPDRKFCSGTARTCAPEHLSAVVELQLHLGFRQTFRSGHRGTSVSEASHVERENSAPGRRHQVSLPTCDRG